MSKNAVYIFHKFKKNQKNHHRWNEMQAPREEKDMGADMPVLLSDPSLTFGNFLRGQASTLGGGGSEHPTLDLVGGSEHSNKPMIGVLCPLSAKWRGHSPLDFCSAFGAAN